MNKLMNAADVVWRLSDGMTIGIGGWAARRKPMALVQALIDSELRDLTIVSYAGPDLGMLCAAGKVKKAVYGFASLDLVPLEPNFRKARQSGAIEAMELDEGMLWLGLQAAAWKVPFLPTRAGPGTDVMRVNPELKTVASPYGDDELVAMPALHLDAALIHVHRADARGNGQILGPDPFFDELFAMAADAVYMSTERVVETAEFSEHCVHTQCISRMFTTGVIEAPRGAGFTDCSPDYPRDDAALKAYAGAK